MVPRYFPDILLCPRESFSLEELHLAGYEMSYYYTFGQLHNNSVGWTGNTSGMTVSQVRDRISVIQSTSDCPELWAVFRDEKEATEVLLEMNLTRVMYPNGRCCRAIVPELSKRKILSDLYFREFVKNFSKMNISGFQMFLSDQMSASFFRPLKFNIDGESLKSDRKRGGYLQFRIKIHEEIHLEDDPHFPCREYHYPGAWLEIISEKYFQNNSKCQK